MLIIPLYKADNNLDTCVFRGKVFFFCNVDFNIKICNLIVIVKNSAIIKCVIFQSITNLPGLFYENFSPLRIYTNVTWGPKKRRGGENIPNSYFLERPLNINER